MATLNSDQDVANKIVSCSYCGQILSPASCVRMRRYVSLININPSAACLLGAATTFLAVFQLFQISSMIEAGLLAPSMRFHDFDCGCVASSNELTWPGGTIIDPLGRPTITAGSDHCFHTCCQYVRPHFSKSSKTNSSENNVHYWRDCGSGHVDHWWHLNYEHFSFWAMGNQTKMHLLYISGHSITMYMNCSII